mgnify:CR=1 FL=1
MRRQRAALAQRRDVAGGVDGAEFHLCAGASCHGAARSHFVVPVEAVHQPVQQRREQQRRGDDEHQARRTARTVRRTACRRRVTGGFTGPMPPNNMAAFRKASSARQVLEAAVAGHAHGERERDEPERDRRVLQHSAARKLAAAAVVLCFGSYMVNSLDSCTVRRNLPPRSAATASAARPAVSVRRMRGPSGTR